MDASTRGLGAYLVEDGVLQEFFYSDLSDTDAAICGHRLGCSDGQQTWEALVALVALRIWSPRWRNKRSCLRVLGDSVTAMVLLLKLKAKGAGPALIAREIALDMADALYQPSVVGHLPGVANTLADYLSRPEKRNSLPLPAALRQARRRVIAPRGRRWWRTLQG